MDKIEPAMQSYIDEGKIAGICTQATHHGKVIHSECYGYLDIEAGKKIQSDSIFRIYSLTKPITAVALLMLIEEGHLTLDDPITNYIPRMRDMKVYSVTSEIDTSLVEMEREITVWHLLTHTSGLCYGTGIDEHPVEAMYKKSGILSESAMLQTSLDELVRRIAGLPLATQPGEIWRYSLAYDVIGYLIQVISDMPFEVYLKERVFEPLEMTDTGFFVPEEKRDRFGPMYSSPEEGEISAVDKGDVSPFLDQELAPSGGAGLVSTIGDYSNFVSFLANGGEWGDVRLLSIDAVENMTVNHLTGGQFPVRFEEPWPGMGHGLGVGVQVEDVSNEGWPTGVFGWIGVSGVTAWIFPKESLSVIAMPQSRFYFDPADTFRKLIYKEIIS